ncbi:MAG: hypothetical protein ACYCU8_15975 [Ferrimicrobium acidiphilum]
MDDIAAKIRAALDAFWEEMALPAMPGEPVTVGELVGPIESMTAVEVLVILDEIVGSQIPSNVIQPGGYKSKPEFVEGLGGRVIDWYEARL